MSTGSGPLAAGAGVIVGGTLPGFLVATVATRIDDSFAFGDGAVGLAVAAFNVVSGAGSVPAGRIVDRVGPAAGLRLAAVSLAVAAAVLAATAQSAAAVVALAAVAGIGNALSGPAAVAMLRRAVARDHQGVAFGWMQAGAPLGSLAAGLALPAIAVPLGWRWAFVATAVLMLVAAETGARMRAADHGVAPAVPDVPAPEAARTPREVWVIAAAAALASAAAIGMVSFLVLYGVDEGMSETAAGLTLVAVSLLSAIGRVLLGSAADRGRGDPLRIAAAMLAASVAGYVLIALGGPGPVVAGAVVVGLAGWSWPGTFNLAAVQCLPGAPGRATGIMLSGLFLGAVAGPLAVGLLGDAGAYTAAWLLCGGLALAAAGVTAWLARRRGTPSAAPA